jgi:hypothetical protein
MPASIACSASTCHPHLAARALPPPEARRAIQMLSAQVDCLLADWPSASPPLLRPRQRAKQTRQRGVHHAASPQDLHHAVEVSGATPLHPVPPRPRLARGAVASAEARATCCRRTTKTNKRRCLTRGAASQKEELAASFASTSGGLSLRQDSGARAGWPWRAGAAYAPPSPTDLTRAHATVGLPRTSLEHPCVLFLSPECLQNGRGLRVTGGTGGDRPVDSKCLDSLAIPRKACAVAGLGHPSSTGSNPIGDTQAEAGSR